MSISINMHAVAETHLHRLTNSESFALELKDENRSEINVYLRCGLMSDRQAAAEIIQHCQAYLMHCAFMDKLESEEMA